MKRLALILVLGGLVLTSCTDDSLNELEINEKQKNEARLVDPAEDPTIDDEDHREN